MKRILSLTLYVCVAAALFSSALVIFAAPVSAQSIYYGDRVPAGVTVENDLILVGNDVVIDGTVNGDVLALGSRVTVNGTVDGSLVTAGETVTLTAVLEKRSSSDTPQGMRLGQDKILEVLRRHNHRRLLVGYEIEPTVLARVRRNCDIPDNEVVLGVIDLTVLRTCANCVALGERGVYFHNDWTGSPPGPGYISYDALKAGSVLKRGFFDVSVDNSAWIKTAGGNRTLVVDVLTDLKAACQQPDN